MIENVEIRQASAEDIKLFYPNGSPYTVQAWLALYKGEPACLAGIIIQRGQIVPFSDVKPDIDAPKMTVYRTAKELFRLIKSLNLTLTTGTEGCRSKFLEKLGFKHIGPLNGWEMYKCHSC